MKRFYLSGASIAALLASPSFSQEPVTDARHDSIGNEYSVEEIIVSARRRDESLIDVPQSVFVVTPKTLEEYNIRNFADLPSVIPGLNLATNNSFSSSVSIRGVQFISEASGNNPTVEFYLNEAPIASNFLFQSLFDVGQIELERGPQGTLRGRAAPSGSFVVSSRKPNLHEVGATFNSTITDQHSVKVDGALNLPLIKDVLALRLAGLVDRGRGNDVKQIDGSNYDRRPKTEADAYRISALFEPTDWLTASLMYQNLENRGLTYAQVISESLVTGGGAATPVARPFDRVSIDDVGAASIQQQQIVLANVGVSVLGQRLSYVGGYTDQKFGNVGGSNAAGYFNPTLFPAASRPFKDLLGFTPVCQDIAFRTRSSATNHSYGQCVIGQAKRESHEIRMASDERIFDMFDYVIGYLYDHNKNPSYLTQETPLLSSPIRVASINLTSIERDGKSTEKSFFGNIRAYLNDRLEVSGGLRHINYDSESSIFVTGSPPNTKNIKDDLKATIYTGSVKYSINPDLMVYVSTGSSWRPGPQAIGNFSVRLSDREQKFIKLNPEKSVAYELGMKGSFSNGRGRFSLSAFYQDFENFVYRTGSVNYVNYRSVQTDGGAIDIPQLSTFNFIAGVPVRVQGLEGDIFFNITPDWSVSANSTYTKSRIKNGVVACNDFTDSNGRPDINPAPPTLEDLQASLPSGQNVAECGLSGPASYTPRFNANIQTSYSHELSANIAGFVRGLVSVTGSTTGSPENDYDQVSAYALTNLYAGLRGNDGRWELSFFAKNLLNHRKIVGIGASPLSGNLTMMRFNNEGAFVGTTSETFVSEYRSVSVTPPREFGVSLTMSLGGR